MNADFFPETQTEPELVPDERYTPRSLFEPLDNEFHFTLDVCATDESAKCKRYITVAEDGLVQSWHGERVFCNPPYSDIRPWVEKAWWGNAPLVVMLLPARTDSDWWAELVEPWRDGRPSRILSAHPTRLSTRFLRGRVRFGHPGNPNGFRVGSPPFWCCLLIFEAES